MDQANDTSNDSHRPEMFRLPTGNNVDPYFSLRRGWFYNAEAAGLIKLVRLPMKGRTRGVTLVPFAEMKALIEKARRDG